MQLDSTMTGLADMTEIAEIDEHGINLNLKLRYHQDIIYTYTGSILIAVNPYKQLAIFTKDYVLKYHAQKFRNLEPHVFALAEAAYRSIIEDNMNQSCVISGESGAGKTETTKFILQYLCAVTSDVSTWVQQQILEANTILEAFGNAKTVRNDNSSRFGKFMQVCFDAKHTIKGCIVQDYLLEQSRITYQSPGERNYHVLYQLVAQGQKNAEMARTFHLRNLDFYQYLNVSGNARIDLEAEAKKFESLTMAFTVLQIPQVSIDGVLRVLSAILWLGNMGFGDVDGETCKLQDEDKEICSIIANLLGLKEEEITHVSLHRQINVRGNITEIPLKLQEARENRHAMAKALYSRTFAWLMSKINTCTNPGQDSKLFLGVLDIFGFENFAKNSFEQLCINYTNEKLHKFFNHYVFALEQEIYKLEEIMFAHVEFTDNSLCLELIEKPPRCIFKLLTEQCHMPKGSDLAYLTNMHTEFEFNPYYVKGNDRRHWEMEFGVKHYAGSVLYAIEGFVEKNRDVQQDVLFDFMSRSDNLFMQELGSFQDQQTLCSATMQRGTSKTKYTVSDNFRQQLQALIDVLQNTRPWYVRCIKPNAEKLPNTYDEKFVLDQLKYLGMIDIVRIRREGYPIHLNLQDFVTNYKCLVHQNSGEYSREKIAQIMRELNLAQTEWQIGKTKLFLRSRAFECLEEKRKLIVNSNALVIQKTWRAYVARKHYRAVRGAALKIQHAYKGWKLRIKFLRMRRAVIIIQSHLRGVFAREVAAALRELRSVNEEIKKREKLALAKQQIEQERLLLKQQQQQQQKLAQEQQEQLPLSEREDSSQTEEEISIKELDDCERLVQQEMIELSHMADQINNKFSNDLKEREKSAENSGDGSKMSNGNNLSGHESVDLDNLFAFLSEVASTNSATNLLAEEIDKMDDLMQDLDKELAHKINEVPPKENGVVGMKLSPKISHLPEPAVPPPPPPVHQAPPPIANSMKPEPIYEAVIPHYTASKPPPIPTLPPIEETLPKKENCVAIESPKYASTPDAIIKTTNKIESPLPQQPLPPLPATPSMATESNTKVPAKEVTTTIVPATNNNDNNVVNNNSGKPEMPNEREQRRKHRVEKKLIEMNNTNDIQKDMLNNDTHYDIMEFADNYFNTHQRTPEGTLIATLTRKNKICIDIPLEEMISFHKGEKIPTSHIHMYDPENVHLACAIFRELSKYMRGELNPERELQAIQYIIGLGIDRDELRDEIFVQCMRQTTNNTNSEWTDRLWLLMCLIIVAFQPSKLLFRYYVSFLKKSLENLEGKLRQYAQWCFDNCKCTKVSARMHPPSSVEVAAMRRLGTIVCRFFFLDGRTKAIDVHPTDTAGDAVFKLADKLNLTNTEGWAIFQSRPDGEEHIKSYDYLYDIIAAWELKQVKGPTNSVNNRRLLTGQGSGENRFVFKKRLFKSTRELSQDPVEVNMLYAQAVYSVVKCDEFPVSEKVALQLAGLQAQVALGDPSIQINPEYYADINNFLPERISKTREPQFWIPILAQAHRQFGSSRNELTAKVLYLSCVMQYPLYGTTMFPVIYKGYWNFGSNIILGVSCEGIMFIQPDEHKSLICQFKYADIESIMLDPSDSFITITLNRMAHHQIYGARAKEFNMPQDIQGCFVFETAQKNEIGSLIVSYCPNLSNWILNNSENPKKHKGLTNEDRTRLYQNVLLCRRQLIDLDALRKPQETGGFLRNTLRRFSKQRLEKLRAEQRNSIQDHSDSYRGFSYAFWAFSRQPLVQCISKFSSDQDEVYMLTIFQSILTYAGLGLTGETVQRAEDEHITIVQTILEKCMRKDVYINELFLMLVKQTTDHPDPNSRVNLRHWALLTLSCSVILPPLKSIRRYLISHLKRCASDYATEEGKYARFAEKCFFKTQSTRRRQNRPSREEIICTINRRPCYARFYFMDGKFYSIEFQPSSTAFEVMEIIKKKIGLRENSMGYAIYEVLGNTERSLLAEEKLTDVMAKWEKNRVTSAQAQAQSQTQQNNTNNCRHQHYMFLFKKHLFLNNFINMDDPVEKELLYHQILHSLRSERFPITEMEAIMLTAIQAQLEYGDCGETLYDYRIVASHCLPPRFVPNIPHEAVAMHHQSLRGMAPAETKKSFLNLIQSWPLHRATIFDVTQTFTSNWPRNLWLAVDRNGIHLLEHRSRNVLCTHDYDSIMSYSPNMNSLMVITGTDKKPSKVILNTTQPFQIATLIKEYSQIVKTPSEVKK